MHVWGSSLYVLTLQSCSGKSDPRATILGDVCRAWWKSADGWEQTLIKRAPIVCLDIEKKTAANENGCSAEDDQETCTEEDKETGSTEESARLAEQVRRPTPICPCPHTYGACDVLGCTWSALPPVASGDIVKSIIKLSDVCSMHSCGPAYALVSGKQMQIGAGRCEA